MLLNAFPLQIVPSFAVVVVRPATLDEAREALRRGSAIGHIDTAAVLSDILREHVPIARVTVPVSDTGDVVVAQYVGPRMQEGTKVLPEGARFEFRRVRWRATVNGDEADTII